MSLLFKKVGKFLPVKVVACAMKEIYRCKKVIENASNANIWNFPLTETYTERESLYRFWMDFKRLRVMLECQYLDSWRCYTCSEIVSKCIRDYDYNWYIERQWSWLYQVVWTIDSWCLDTNRDGNHATIIVSIKSSISAAIVAHQLCCILNTNHNPLFTLATRKLRLLHQSSLYWIKRRNWFQHHMHWCILALSSFWCTLSCHRFYWAFMIHLYRLKIYHVLCSLAVFGIVWPNLWDVDKPKKNRKMQKNSTKCWQNVFLQIRTKSVFSLINFWDIPLFSSHRIISSLRTINVFFNIILNWRRTNKSHTRTYINWFQWNILLMLRCTEWVVLTLALYSQYFNLLSDKPNKFNQQET